MSDKKTVSIKRTLELKEVITYLNDIAAGLKAGTVCVQHGDEFVTVKPNAFVELEIDAEQKKSKEKLVIELAWRKEEEKIENEMELKITTTEPEVPEPVEETASLKEASAG